MIQTAKIANIVEPVEEADSLNEESCSVDIGAEIEEGTLTFNY